MALGKNDLKVTNGDGHSHLYVTDPAQPQGISHEAGNVNVPLNASAATPVSAGGQYDVRDTEGQKAITHLEWGEGRGQLSLDKAQSSWARYLESWYVNIAKGGELGLLHPVETFHWHNTAGPVFASQDMVWLGVSPGRLYRLERGEDVWEECTITDVPQSSISSFTTDGHRLYFAVSGGSATGVWANFCGTAGTYSAFKHFPCDAGGSPVATVTAAGIQELAYNGGFLFGATAAGAGIIDSATGAYTQYTPAFLNVENSTVALVSMQNSVYWIVSKSGRSYAYELKWDAAASTMTTEQYAEFPESFVATCAVGYLGNLDIGGYFDSTIPGTGKGSVYRINNGYMALLMEIGEQPEDTAVPAELDAQGRAVNDNRIRAAVAGGKDEYFLTERACYRWDLDAGGHSHVFDFLGAGAVSRVTNEFAADVLPTGGTITTDGSYTVHTFTSTGTLAVPTHIDAFGNPVATIPAEVLVVGGGGGGGTNIGGGGGGGEVIAQAVTLEGSMAVTIAAAAAANADGGECKIADHHAATLVHSHGGGAGGAFDENGNNGACGGGAGGSSTGYAGGTASGASPHGHGGANDYEVGGIYPAGGGGGAGGVGGSAVETTEVP